MEQQSRACGLLLPVSALPSPYGIGTLGEDACRFADFTARAGCRYWQVLPLHPTSYGDSPYQSFSAFAGNPYLIDLQCLIEQGMLETEDLGGLQYRDDRVDYDGLYRTRLEVLYQAFGRFDPDSAGYRKFCAKHRFWLEEYCLFMALKEAHDGAPWWEFDRPLKIREKKAMKDAARRLEDRIAFHRFLQYQFFSQLRQLKRYLKNKGLQLIGDLPIYTAMDSADVYFHPELFQMDAGLSPTAVAGCPPDAYSPGGQLWGNPLYNWPVHKQTGFAWWIRRLQHAFVMYDVVRIDHFRGFDRYYSIPARALSAKSGRWKKAPGAALFKTAKQTLGELPIIAEDLGLIDDGVRRLLRKTGFMGMKVLQFAFDDGDPQNVYLPHAYEKHCVVYTGTHDNPTLKQFYKQADQQKRKWICEYLHCADSRAVDALLRAAVSSPAALCILPAADVLGLGAEARINTPSTLGGNWEWRMTPEQLQSERAGLLNRLNHIYGRL